MKKLLHIITLLDRFRFLGTHIEMYRTTLTAGAGSGLICKIPHFPISLIITHERFLSSFSCNRHVSEAI